jgi:hypothetical protein
MYIYIIIAIIIIYFTFFSQVDKENFTDDENLLGNQILLLFKQPIYSFADYLATLTKFKNTSDNLISKKVYNTLKDNANLTLNDIMKEF